MDWIEELQVPTHRAAAYDMLAQDQWPTMPMPARAFRRHGGGDTSYPSWVMVGQHRDTPIRVRIMTTNFAHTDMIDRVLYRGVEPYVIRWVTKVGQVRAAQLVDEVRRMLQMGGKGEAHGDWRPLKRASQRVLAQWDAEHGRVPEIREVGAAALAKLPPLEV